MDFLQTAQYSEADASIQDPPPEHWRLCIHPNTDIYFYHPQLRLVTTNDVRQPDTLRNIMDAHRDILQDIVADTNLDSLPDDYELVFNNVSDSASEIRVYSRSTGAVYEWEENGFTLKSREHFWTLVAEYPSHHPDIPPNTESEFSEALFNAKREIANGIIFGFNEGQIDSIIARYRQLTSLRSQGRNTTSHLAWLMGAVMPLDAVGRQMDDQRIAAMMNGLHT